MLSSNPAQESEHRLQFMQSLSSVSFSALLLSSSSMSFHSNVRPPSTGPLDSLSIQGSPDLALVARATQVIQVTEHAEMSNSMATLHSSFSTLPQENFPLFSRTIVSESDIWSPGHVHPGWLRSHACVKPFQTHERTS